MAQINILLKLLNSAGIVIDPATQATLAALLAQHDITTSALRDALRGGGAKTLTDLATALDTLNTTLKATLDLETSLWTDNSDAYYVRRESVNEGTGAITITFTDSAGNIVTPGAGLRPLATTGKVVEQAYFDATAGGTGYSSGDILARVSIIDPSATPPSVVALWLNVTTGATLATPPTGGTYVEVTRNVTVSNMIQAVETGLAKETSLGRRNNLGATLLNLLPSATTQKVLRLKGHGANAQFDYHLRNAYAAAVDAATWEALRFRKVGPSSAATATYSRSGTTVTVTHTSAHNLETGDLAYHTGATDTGLNGYAKVTVTSSLIYTFTTASGGTATGEVTLQPDGPEVKYRTGVNLTALESGW